MLGISWSCQGSTGCGHSADGHPSSRRTAMQALSAHRMWFKDLDWC